MTRRAEKGHASRSLFRVAALVALPLACVSGPASNTAVPAGTRTLTFTGVYPHQADTRVTVHVEVLQAGRWVTIGPSVEAPVEGAWTLADVPVPDDAWTGHCEAAVFRVRTGAGGLALFGHDRACLDAAGPALSLGDALGCLTPRLVVFRRSPGETFTGNVSVANQDQADGYACVSTIEGNLTVTAESRVTGTTSGDPVYTLGLKLGMPNLVSVTGLAAIDSGRTETIRFSQLSRVGTADRPETGLRFTQYAFNSSTRGDFAFTHLEVPRLTRVAGTLQVEAENPDGVPMRAIFPVGLDAITSAESVSLHNASAGTAYLSGLLGLTEVTRDLSFQYDHWELQGNIVPAVTRVGRDLTIRVGNQLVDVLPVLTAVGRNVTIAKLADRFCSHLGTTRALPVLTTVGGDLTISGCPLGRCTRFMQGLTTLTGSLRLIDATTGDRARVGATGASHLAIGGLALEGTLVQSVPLHDDVAVAPTGTVLMTANTNLCECHAQAFIDRLVGFTGSATHTGNRVCAPCPPTAACP